MSRSGRPLVRVVALLTAASWLSACAFLNGSHQKVWFSTNVPAKVYAGDRLLVETTGEEPTAVRLRRGKQYALVARAEGHEDASVVLDRQVSLLGTLDLIGAILIALPVVTFATGHAYSLDPRRVRLELGRISSEAVAEHR